MKRLVLCCGLLLGTAQSATLPSQTVLTGTCCAGAVWSPDSRSLLFLDGSPARPTTGIYQVAATGGAVTRRFSSVAFYSPRLRWAVRPTAGDTTVLERLADGRKFTLPTRGSDVLWNGDETKLAYMRSDITGNYDRRATRVYIANAFGAGRQVATVYGGGATAWLSDIKLLLTGKTSATNRDRELFTLDLQSGAKKVLRSSLGFRGVSASPDGKWVVYTISFDSPERNGLWLQNTAGGPPTELGEFGSYRWRDAGRLLLIPLSPSSGPHVLKQYDVTGGTWSTLGDLGDQVRQGDWNVSPDGTRISYLSAKDGNVRVLKLP